MFKRRMVHAHMRAAQAYGATSYARRLQVGAVIVDQTTDQPVSIGWNGTEPGQPNICDKDDGHGGLVSVEGVVHAEINAMRKLRARHDKSTLSLFVSHSPCPDCARAIVRSGLKQVFFNERYRLDEGIKILLSGGVELYQVGYDEVWKISMSLDDVATVPAEYDDKDILLTKARKRIISRNFPGLKTFNEPWYTREVRTMLEMFDDGSDVYEISITLDRSMGTVVEKLKRHKRLSFMNGTGAMKTIDGQRVLWCSILETKENRMAIESAYELIVPEVHAYMDNTSDKIEDLIEAFKHKMAPTLIRRAYHRK